MFTIKYNGVYALAISQSYLDLEDVEIRLISTDFGLLDDFSDGSVTGHKCASSVISVAAFDIEVSCNGEACAPFETERTGKPHSIAQSKPACAGSLALVD